MSVKNSFVKQVLDCYGFLKKSWQYKVVNLIDPSPDNCIECGPKGGLYMQCASGMVVSDVTVNADGDLLVTYTDGTSVTRILPPTTDTALQPGGPYTPDTNGDVTIPTIDATDGSLTGDEVVINVNPAPAEARTNNNQSDADAAAEVVTMPPGSIICNPKLNADGVPCQYSTWMNVNQVAKQILPRIKRHFSDHGSRVIFSNSQTYMVSDLVATQGEFTPVSDEIEVFFPNPTCETIKLNIIYAQYGVIITDAAENSDTRVRIAIARNGVQRSQDYVVKQGGQQDGKGENSGRGETLNLPPGGASHKFQLMARLDAESGVPLPNEMIANHAGYLTHQSANSDY